MWPEPNAVLKNTLTVLRGTVVAQAMGFIALPLLTRLFTPEAFGQLQLYQAALTLLLVVAAMRYEIALLRAADDAEFTATLQLCLLINVAVALVVAVACAVGTAIGGLIPASAMQVLWLLPVGVLLGGCVQTLGYLTLRHKAFGAGASAKMAQAGGYVAGGVGIGLAAPLPIGLVMADLLGRVANIGTLALHRSIFPAAIFALPTRRTLRRVAMKFREFPLVSVPGGLINAAGGTMTALLMYGAFDASVSGQYGLVERSLMLPVGMVAVAVSQVFTADLSASLRDGGAQALGLFRSVVRRMFLMGLAPALAVGLLAPWVFGHLFGTNWVLSGEFARIMAPLLLVSLITGSVNMAIMILGWQKVQLGWEMVRLAVVALAWLGVVHFGLKPALAVAMHVAANMSMNLLYLWLADHMLRRHAMPPALADAPAHP